MQLSGLNLFNTPFFNNNAATKQVGFQPKITLPGARAAEGKNPFEIADKILRNHLAKLGGIDPKSVEKDAPTNIFNPKEIAKNVLNFVQARLKLAEADGADEDQLKQLRAEAKAGVNQGIDEANDILGGLGLLSDDVKQGIAQARDLIFDGIEGKSKNTNLIEASGSFRQVEKQGFQLEVKTQDGDTVTLRFEQVDKQAFEANFRQSGEGESLSVQRGYLSSSQLSFSVEGDLDDAELESIRNLVKDVNKVADTFFDGDVQAAFERGLDLGFDTEQIASFALQLNHSVSSVATASYREVSTQDAPQLPGAEQLSSLLSELRSIVDQTAQLFADAAPKVGSLFQSLLERQPKSGPFADLLAKNQQRIDEVGADLVKQANGIQPPQKG